MAVLCWKMTGVGPALSDRNVRRSRRVIRRAKGFALVLTVVAIAMVGGLVTLLAFNAAEQHRLHRQESLRAVADAAALSADALLRTRLAEATGGAKAPEELDLAALAPGFATLTGKITLVRPESEPASSPAGETTSPIHPVYRVEIRAEDTRGAVVREFRTTR